MFGLLAFILTRRCGSCACGGGQLDAGLSPQTGAALWADGVDGAAGAGAQSVHRLFLLWDCHRRVRRHSPGDINPQLKKKPKLTKEEVFLTASSGFTRFP